MLRHNRLVEEEEYKILGANLWTILFDNKIGESLNDALRSGPTETQLVRVELVFDKGQEELASWPNV